MKPEEQARQQIDDGLTQAGWCVQDRAQLNLSARRGIAIREFSLATGAADYLLFVDRQAVGTVEAKKVGETLTGVEEQSAKYLIGLPPGVHAAREPPPFAYESTGIETRFISQLDPEPRSRPVFTFHRPETLANWLAQPPAGMRSAENGTLRARLRRLPARGWPLGRRRRCPGRRGPRHPARYADSRRLARAAQPPVGAPRAAIFS